MITKEMIEDYINDEISYIEKYDYENCKNDIIYLKSLTTDDIDKVKQHIERDDELRECINECLNYYIYHIKK